MKAPLQRFIDLENKVIELQEQLNTQKRLNLVLLICITLTMPDGINLFKTFADNFPRIIAEEKEAGRVGTADVEEAHSLINQAIESMKLAGKKLDSMDKDDTILDSDILS